MQFLQTGEPMSFASTPSNPLRSAGAWSRSGFGEEKEVKEKKKVYVTAGRVPRAIVVNKNIGNGI